MMFSAFRTLTRRLPLSRVLLSRITSRTIVRGARALGFAVLAGLANQIYRMDSKQQKANAQGLKSFQSIVVCPSTEIKEGIIRNVDLPNGRKVIIIRYKGKLHAVSGQCTYDNESPLSEGVCFGDKLFCCEHGCAYDIQTGRVEMPPAMNDLPRFFVQQKKGEVILYTPIKMPISIEPLTEGRDYTDMRKVVIVGNGMATLGCIQGLRQNGYTGEITVITKDSYQPYNDEVQINTFKNMYKNTQKLSEKPFPRPQEWYKEMGVQFIYNQQIKDIDARQHYPFVMLQDELKIEYDALLLNMGTSPVAKKIPGLAKGGSTFVLQDKEDYDDFAHKIASDQVKSIAVVGYNLKALDFIRTIKREFPAVSIAVIDPNEKNVVEEKIGPELALLLAEDDSKYGVSFYLRVPVLSVQRHMQKMTINMKYDQKIVTDAIVMFPNNEITNAIHLQKSKLVDLDMTKSGKIKTDQNCRTSNKQIFAAGKGCIVHYFYGQELLPCVNNRMAYQEGYTAAYNMLALNVPFHLIPFQSIESIGRKIKLVGNTNVYDQVTLFGDIDEWDFVVLYSLTGYVVGCATSSSQKKIAGIIEQALREQLLPQIGGFKKQLWTFKKLEEAIRKNNKAGCYKDPIDSIRQTYKTNPRDILWMHRDVQGVGMREADDPNYQKRPMRVDKDGYVNYPHM